MPQYSLAIEQSCESSLSSQIFHENIYWEYYNQIESIDDKQQAWQQFTNDISKSEELWVNEKVIAFIDAQYLTRPSLFTYVKAIETRLKWQRYPYESYQQVLARIRHPWLAPGATSVGKKKIYSHANVDSWNSLSLAKYAWQLSLALREIIFKVSYINPSSSGPSTYMGHQWQEKLPGVSPPQHWMNYSRQEVGLSEVVLDNILLNDPNHYALQVERVWGQLSTNLSKLYKGLSRDVNGFQEWETSWLRGRSFLDLQEQQAKPYQRGPSMRQWYWQNLMRVFIVMGLLNTLPHVPEAASQIDEYYKNGRELITGLADPNVVDQLNNSFHRNMAIQVKMRQKDLLVSLASKRKILQQQGLSEEEIENNKDIQNLELLYAEFKEKYKAYLEFK